jgi:CRP-like cAMP-binding protein
MTSYNQLTVSQFAWPPAVSVESPRKLAGLRSHSSTRTRKVVSLVGTLDAGAATPRKNRLLAALPDDELKQLLPDLESVHLPRGDVLHEPGSNLKYAYFLTTAVVSLTHVLQDGVAPEVATIGSEGVVGLPLLLGGNSMHTRAVVLSPGAAYRLGSHAVGTTIKLSSPVMHVLLRYTQALLTQMGQTAVCNRHHSLKQQLSRWLLLNLDRLPGEELSMTQELIANLLGVRREAVSEVALKLQEAGVIRYARGHIQVLDRLGLERRACECYAVVKSDFERLLPATSLKATLTSFRHAG